MWLFNSCHLPAFLAGFPASPLSPSEYSAWVRRNQELNLSSAWMHRSHLKFCGLGKFTWRLCPIILSLAIWTVWASRMVSQAVPLSLCQLTELLYRPNRFLSSKDDGAVSFCHATECDILSETGNSSPPEFNRIKYYSVYTTRPNVWGHTNVILEHVIPNPWALICLFELCAGQSKFSTPN